MNKKYVTIGLLFVLLVSFSSSQSQPVVGHPASEVTPGSFQVGDYILPAGSKIGIGTTTPGAKLEVLGT